MAESFQFKVYPSAWQPNNLNTPAPGEEFVALVSPVYDAGRVFKPGVYSIDMSLSGAQFTAWTRAGFSAQTVQRELQHDVHYLDVPQGGTGTATSDGHTSDAFFIYASARQYDIITVTVSTPTARPPAPPTAGGGTVSTIVRDDSDVVMDNPTVGQLPAGVTGGSATPAHGGYPAQSAWQMNPAKDVRGTAFVTEDKVTRPIDGRYTPTVTVEFPPGLRALHSNKGSFQADLVWYSSTGAELGTSPGTPVPFSNLGWQAHPSFDILNVGVSGHETHTTVTALRPGKVQSLPGMQSVLFGKNELFAPTVSVPAGSSFSVMGAVDASAAAAGSTARVSFPTIADAKLQATQGGIPPTSLTPGLAGTQWRWVVHVSSGKPWDPGTTEDVVVLRQPWQNGYPTSYTTPDFTLPANAWLKVELEVQTGSAVSTTGLTMNFGGGFGNFITWESLPAGAAVGGPTATATQTGVTGSAPAGAVGYGVRITYTPDAADQYTTYDQLTVLFTDPKVTVTWDAPNPHFWAVPNKNYIGVMSLLGDHFTDGDTVVSIDRLSSAYGAKETPIYRGNYVIRGEKFYFYDTTVPFNDKFVYRLTVRSADGTHKTEYLTLQMTYPSDMTFPHDSTCVPVFLSDPLVPSLSLWTGLMSIDPLSHPGRRELNDVIGRHTPVSLSDVRGTPRTVFHILTRTLAEREHLLTTLATGRILFFRNPDPRYPENNWFISVGEVTENRILPDHARPERTFDLEVALVNRPAGLLSMAGGGRTFRDLRDFEPDGTTPINPRTFQHVRDAYTDFIDVLLGEPTGFININNNPEYVYGAGLYPTRVAAETSWSLV